jgi:hypothetical protein
MPVSESEMREDVRKVRIRKHIYFLGGLGILGLGVALVVIFFIRREWPALLLAGVGAFWSVTLFYQAFRTRGLERLIRVSLEEHPGAVVPPELEGALEGVDAEAGSESRGDVPAEGGVPGEP